jgi:single-stranded-DNA-specific exonuclease
MNLTSVTGKNWIFKKFNNADVKKYSENYSLDEIVARLIAIRKKNIKNIDLFINPTIKNLMPNPFKLQDMNLAVERTCESIKKKELIGIFGDYDVDGATSVAILSRYFLSLNQKIYTYIPDRKKDGYGPNIENFKKLINLGIKIILTVDCGTSSFEPIKLAQEKKVDVIVLDHHQAQTKLPNAFAIVNPNRIDDKSELNYLCAAGVCFVFLVALNKKLRELGWFIKNDTPEPNILEFLDLVSLGTVCDVVPLIELNRAFVKQGLKILKKRSNLGLKTLYDMCKINSQPTTYDLGFALGPRINAGGRVGKSSHGVELLLCNEPQVAYKIATDLDKSNQERKSIELLLTEKVSHEVKKYHNHPVLVLSGENWHEGVMGIVASRIKDKFNKPTFLISFNKEEGKGSARSIYGFDVGSEIIKAVQLGILQKGGGHKMAGGFLIKKKNIDIFRDQLIKDYEKLKINSTENENFYIDAIVSPSAINEEFYEHINYLAPFGSGNNEPKFMVEKLKVLKSYIVADKHIRSTLLGRDGSVIKTFAWNVVNTPIEAGLNINNKKLINITGKIRLNEWKGNKSIEFIIEDLSV